MRENTTIILELLHEHKQLYGMEIVSLSGISVGSVYTTLDRMEAKGLIKTWQLPSQSEKPKTIRYAKITPNGKIYLKGKLLTERATAGGK